MQTVPQNTPDPQSTASFEADPSKPDLNPAPAPVRETGFGLWVRDLAILATAIVLFMIYLYQPVRVEGTSMLPRLEDRDRLFINKFVYHISAIEHGDVVVFRYPRDPQKSYIKRVIALPGDLFKAVKIGRIHSSERRCNRFWRSKTGASSAATAMAQLASARAKSFSILPLPATRKSPPIPPMPGRSSFSPTRRSATTAPTRRTTNRQSPISRA